MEEDASASRQVEGLDDRSKRKPTRNEERKEGRRPNTRTQSTRTQNKEADKKEQDKAGTGGGGKGGRDTERLHSVLLLGPGDIGSVRPQSGSLLLTLRQGLAPAASVHIGLPGETAKDVMRAECAWGHMKS